MALRVGARQVPREAVARRADAELALGQIDRFDAGLQREAERAEAVLADRRCRGRVRRGRRPRSPATSRQNTASPSGLSALRRVGVHREHAARGAARPRSGSARRGRMIERRARRAAAPRAPAPAPSAAKCAGRSSWRGRPRRGRSDSAARRRGVERDRQAQILQRGERARASRRPRHRRCPRPSRRRRRAPRRARRNRRRGRRCWRCARSVCPSPNRPTFRHQALCVATATSTPRRFSSTAARNPAAPLPSDQRARSDARECEARRRRANARAPASRAAGAAWRRR